MTMALSVICFRHGAPRAFRREGKGPCGSHGTQPVTDVSRTRCATSCSRGPRHCAARWSSCSGSRWCSWSARQPAGESGVPLLQPGNRHAFLHDRRHRARPRHRIVPAVHLRGPGVRGASRKPPPARSRSFASTTRRPAPTSTRIRPTERDHVIATWPQFAFEGPAYYAMPDAGSDGRIGLFRFFNTKTGAHFYTTSTAERDKVLATLPQFAYEGVAFYVYSADNVPVPPVRDRVVGWLSLPAADVVRADAADARARQGDRRARVPRGAVRRSRQRLSGCRRTTTCRSTNPTIVRSARRARARPTPARSTS